MIFTSLMKYSHAFELWAVTKMIASAKFCAGQVFTRHYYAKELLYIYIYIYILLFAANSKPSFSEYLFS